MGKVIRFPTANLEHGTMFVLGYAPGDTAMVLVLHLSDSLINGMLERIDMLHKIRNEIGEPIETITYKQTRPQHFDIATGSRKQEVYEAIRDTFDQAWTVTPYTTEYNKFKAKVDFARMVISEGGVHWEIHTNQGSFQTAHLTREDVEEAGAQRFRPGSDRTDGRRSR